jgi:hypothetical protein
MTRHERDTTAVLIACAFAFGVVLGTLPNKCKAQTVGVHIATKHFDDHSHTSTPGLYAVLPVGVLGGRVVLGGYRNSLTTPKRRTSFYVAQTWEWGRYSAMVGVVSGYHVEEDSCGERCVRKWGHTRGALGPIAAVSVAWPEAKPLLGAVPRLSLIPAGVHLSLERSF